MPVNPNVFNKCTRGIAYLIKEVVFIVSLLWDDTWNFTRIFFDQRMAMQSPLNLLYISMYTWKCKQFRGLNQPTLSLPLPTLSHKDRNYAWKWEINVAIEFGTVDSQIFYCIYKMLDVALYWMKKEQNLQETNKMSQMKEYELRIHI